MDTDQCPNETQLQEYAVGTLPRRQLGDMVSHVSACSRCANVLAAIEQLGTDDLTGLLREPVPEIQREFLKEACYRDLVGRLSGLSLTELNTETLSIEAPAERALAPGQTLGQYKLTEVIGRGGMGIVYKARHLKLKRDVALKTLARGRFGSRESQQRFDREMQAIARLDHPNIVRALDADEIEGIHFLVMEFVPGANLSEVLKQHGPFDVKDACSIISQAACGLLHIHENGLVHRDLKPGNLLLNDEGTVRILDLGLAMLSDAQTPPSRLTSTGLVMGTIDFMAPEQADEDGQVSHQADLYGLGATLFAMLTGAGPFGHRKFSSILTKLNAIATERAPSIAEFRNDVPPELCVIVERMLDRNPDTRFSSAAEVMEALSPFSHSGKSATLGALGEASEGGAPPSSEDAHKTAAQAGHRRYWLTCAFVTIGLIVLWFAVQQPWDGDQSKSRITAASSALSGTHESRNADSSSADQQLQGQEPDTGTIRSQHDLDELTSDLHSADEVYLRFTENPEEHEELWQSLQPGPDDTVRTHLISRMSQEGTSPDLLLEWLSQEWRNDRKRPVGQPNSTGLRASLLFVLGAAPPEWFRSHLNVRSQLIDWYLNDPDPIVHSAVDWAMRRAGLERHLDDAKPLLQQKRPPRKRGWYTTMTGHTMAVIPLPGKVLIGSPDDEEGRFTEKPLQNESQRYVTIDYPFAISTCEVTREQFQSSDVRQGDAPRPLPTSPGLPQNACTWSQAAAYCNWLSLQEGLSTEELCYEQIEETTEYRCKSDALELSGYRLPTDDEWEVAARGGTTTARYFGRNVERLDEYSFTGDNVGGVVQPVGTLRPNGFGLFDMLGNVSEWIHSRVQDSSGRILRRMRGGSAWTSSGGVRSAARYHYQHDRTTERLGFRVARTIRFRPFRQEAPVDLYVGPPVRSEGSRILSTMTGKVFTRLADDEVICLGTQMSGDLIARRFKMQNTSSDSLTVTPGWVEGLYEFRDLPEKSLGPGEWTEFSSAIDPSYFETRPGYAAIRLKAPDGEIEVVGRLCGAVRGALCTILELEDSATEGQFSFGTVPVAADVQHAFSVWNQGNIPLVLNNISATEGFRIVRVPEEPIAPAAFGHIVVSVDTHNPGSRTGIVSIQSNDGLNPNIGIPVRAEVAESLGFSSIGVYRKGLWLFDHDFDGESDEQIHFGEPDDLPVTGDWNGDGICDIGVCRPDGRFRVWDLKLRGDTETDEPWKSVRFHEVDCVPVAADFDGDGITSLGVVSRTTNGRNLRWIIRTAAGGTIEQYTPGLRGRPVVGDWNSDGADDKAVILTGDVSNGRQLRWKLYSESASHPEVPVMELTFGVGIDIPITGDWNGDGKSDIGVFRTVNGAPTEWLLDVDGKGGIPERESRFGKKEDIPVVLSPGHLAKGTASNAAQ